MNQPPQILQILDRSRYFKNLSQVRPETNRNYGVWPPPQQQQDSVEVMKYGANPMNVGFACPRPRTGSNKRIRSNELQNQNQYRLKKGRRRFYHKKRLYGFAAAAAPDAPRNTSSFLIRAKKSGGVADLVSPCPVTPAVLATPNLSPLREVVGDMAKEEWGVDGYGSMKGLIRLRSPGGDESAVLMNEEEDEMDDDDGASTESDDNDDEEEEDDHMVVMERRLDHDVISRFEMICPNNNSNGCDILEDRVDFQKSHISKLEEENVWFKNRICLMEKEMREFRTRLECLENEESEKELLAQDDDDVGEWPPEGLVGETM